MARKDRRHMLFADDGGLADTAGLPTLSKQKFGKRVMDLLVKIGINQSELAKRAGISRNQVSTYVRGISFPTPQSLKKIAKVLQVDPDVLLPNHIHQAIADDQPYFEMRISALNPEMASVRINAVVMRSTADKIKALLDEDQAVVLIKRQRRDAES